MLSIFIRKRTLILITLILLGIALVILGYLGIPGVLVKKDKASSVPDLKVEAESKHEQAQESTNAIAKAKTGERNKLTSSDFLLGEGNGSDIFVEYRLDRERARSQQVELLRGIINSTSSESQTRSQAQEQLLAISKNMVKEVELENLLRARGFQNVAVYLEENGATVVVQSPGFSSKDAPEVCEMVSRKTGLDRENIVVIPRK